MNRNQCYVALIATCVSATVLATDRDEYNRRSAERFVTMFRSADLDQDNIVSREQVTGTVELAARFEEVDTNRDDNISWNELTRFIEANFR